MPDSTRRRSLIREIIASSNVSTQTELVSMLHQRGIHCTQASVSRDISTLGLVKVSGRYSLSMGTPSTNNLKAELTGRIVQVSTAGDCLIVLSTDPGVASIVALTIDNARWDSVTGTIAGDDTIFIACDGKAAQDRTMLKLQNLAPDAFA